MSVKAGQKCTAIRKAIVPAARAAEVTAALRAALGRIVVGDPRLENVRMGPVASLGQRREVLEQITRLKREAEVVVGESSGAGLVGADADRGAFVSPTLLYCRDPSRATAIHSVEAFGPVCTLMPYSSVDEAIALARRGGGSLAGSIFSADDALAAQLVLGLAPFHGRIVVINRHCAQESTGHGSPLPHLVHGGPGRAGGGEELGGIRGVMHYMQRTAVQGTPDVITAVTGRWVRGARELNPGTHPFRKPFAALVIGDTFNSAEREITVADIERFAALSGDTFYAHMDETQAARNPLFGGPVRGSALWSGARELRDRQPAVPEARETR
jgi:oxepin-CoA hydrolase/3-oxo-5,6-dehydrosuberyl-CoA semialdehyde dehydrogenase